MAHAVLVTAMVLGPLAMAHADATFLHRDGPVTPAYMYPDGDGAEPTAPAERIGDTAPPSRTGSRRSVAVRWSRSPWPQTCSRR